MGFLGFGNYSRPGKGVKKDEREKKRFFAFFELFFRKIGKLVQLNLLYVLFCIPIITIGPATVALMKIVRYYDEGKPVFLLSDFFDAFKQSFLQGLIMGIITTAVTVLAVVAIMFYYAQCSVSLWYFIPLGFIVMITMVATFASFYTFLLISSVNLKLFSILKNSVMLAFLGLKSNIFTLIFAGAIIAGTWLFVPITIPLAIFISFSLSSLIICYNSFQHIYKYIVRPYYIANELPDPYEKAEDEDSSIFEDATV